MEMAVNFDQILDPLYRVDKFLRYELTQTLSHGGALEPNKEWVVVSDSLHQLRRLSIDLQPTELECVDETFVELQQNLNSILGLFRRIALEKGSPNFDESQYLEQANSVILETQNAFQARLYKLEKLLQQRASPANLSDSSSSSKLPDVKPLADQIIDKLKSNKVIALLSVISVFIISSGQVADAWEKIAKLISTPPSTEVANRQQKLQNENQRFVTEYLNKIQLKLEETESLSDQLNSDYLVSGWGILESYIWKARKDGQDKHALMFGLISQLVKRNEEIVSLLEDYEPYASDAFKLQSSEFREHARTYVIRFNAIEKIIETNQQLPTWKPFPTNFPAELQKEIAARNTQMSSQ